MATEAMIEYACRPDRDLHKPALHNPVASGHLIGELEEETDPYEQARAARWLRRHTPQDWRLLLDMLGLPDGGPLTAWPGGTDRESLVVCLAEVRVHEARLQPDEPDELDEDDEIETAAPPAPVVVSRRDREWMDRAACKTVDVDVFFPHDSDEEGIADATKVCAVCPVRTACLDYAVDAMVRDGVWGGLTSRQRKNVRRRRLARAAVVEPPPVPEPAVVEKQCGCCGVIQPASAFSKDSRRRDRLHLWCRECANEANRRRRREAKQAMAS